MLIVPILGLSSTNPRIVQLRFQTWNSTFELLNPRFGIIPGLHVTYPPDSEAIKLPGENPPNLAEKVGIAYIPLYTPTKRLVHQK